jgi:multisubunit Na+/H+ antiporter MnhF subunit
MSNLLNLVLWVALVLHLCLIAACVWRVWRGDNAVDRLTSADVIGTLVLAVLILMAMLLRDGIFIELALSLAILGFVGTLALARYITLSFKN